MMPRQPDGFASPEMLDLKLAKVEHAVLIWPDAKPEPPFYSDCREAWAVVVAAGAGMVVTRVTYQSDWWIHEPHPPQSR
jgi:hypothetical protein